MKTIEERKQYMKNWHSANKHNQKEYVIANKDSIAKYKKAWANANPDKISDSIKTWKKNNPEKLKKIYNKSVKKRKTVDGLFRLKCNVRSMLSKSFRRKGYGKTTKSYKILGCSFEFLKQYIENQFEPWMNWDNWGKYNHEFNYGWDIDHIIPLSSAKNEEDIIKLNNYTNLRPLCSHINRDIKNNNLI